MSDVIQECFEAANLAYAAGLCIIPPAEDGSKRPLPNNAGRWDAYKSCRATQDELDKWYPGRSGLGVVTGTVSGHVECWDFDERSTYENFISSARQCGLGEIVDRIEAG